MCENEIIAFGLNALEFWTIFTAAFIVFLVGLGIGLVMYLNQGIGETKEERWERKNPFLAVDKNRRGRGTDLY